MAESFSIGTPAQLAATIPNMLGYHPSAEHVAVVALNNGSFSEIASAEWVSELGEAQQFAALVAEQLYEAMGGAASRFITVGYGEEGRDRALLLEDALRQRGVEKTDAWSVQGDQLSIFLGKSGWSAPVGLDAAISTDYAIATGSTPAASKDDLARAYQPARESDQAQLPTDLQDRVRTMAPSQLYELGSRALSAAVASKTGMTTEQAAAVALAVASHDAIRDKMVADCIGNPTRAERLVDAFRVADDARRPATAEAAAAAMFLNEASPVAIDAITKWAGKGMGSLVREASQRGVSGKAFGAHLSGVDLDQPLAAADRQHYRRQLGAAAGRSSEQPKSRRAGSGPGKSFERGRDGGDELER